VISNLQDNNLNALGKRISERWSTCVKPQEMGKVIYVLVAEEMHLDSI